ncbi:MAG: response regulator transcription factor [Eubacteriales bacterium]
MMEQEKQPYKILAVDDDTRIRLLLTTVLESRGYSVVTAENGQDGLDAFKREKPHLVVLDIMMPVMDGLACAKEIRKVSDCPILMLTAKGEEYDQVEGFNTGADDYVVKPFAPMVLIARIEALLRRAYGDASGKKQYGILSLVPEGREVLVSGDTVNLSRKEYDLLTYLVENHHLSLSRDQILEAVWGYDYLGSDSTVDTHINRLRNKLKSASDYIVTLRGFGYKFDPKE